MITNSQLVSRPLILDANRGLDTQGGGDGEQLCEFGGQLLSHGFTRMDTDDGAAGTSILLICPTRSRNGNHRRLAESFLATNPCRSELVFGLDEDDAGNYARVADGRVSYFTGPRKRCVGTVNRIVRERVSSGQELIGVLGDDSVFRSADWESQVWAARGRGALVIGPADMRFNENLPASYFVDARVVRALGFLMPPCLEHLCGDDFLLGLGRALGRFEFIPGCLIEHLHYSVNKAPVDDLYRECNCPAQFERDELAFDQYLAESFGADVRKVAEALDLTVEEPPLPFKRRPRLAGGGRA